MCSQRLILAGFLLVLLPCSPLLGHPGTGIAVDKQGNVYCVDQLPSRIVKITPAGTVNTLAAGIEGEGTERIVRFENPHSLAVDERGNLYTCGDAGNTGVWKIDARGVVTRHYPPQGWYQQVLMGSGGDPFAVDAAGAMYCVNEKPSVFCQILRVSPEGRVTNFAGGEWGSVDGDRDSARLSSLHGSAMTFGPDGCLYFTEQTRVRKIARDGRITTLAGSGDGGYVDDTGGKARFSFVRGLTVASDGAVYVVDAGNLRIRKVDAQGTVTTVAGTGNRGGTDGKGDTATFEEPSGVARDDKGNLFVLEMIGRDWRPRVRKVTPDRTVSTLAVVTGDKKPER
jgi:serine/threonine-protein kinase